MHVRGQIREAFKADLETIPALTKRIFYDSDEVPQEDELPCAIVEIGDEEIDHETLSSLSGGALLKRDAFVSVSIIHQADRDALLVAEELAALIETKVATSTALEDLARTWFLRSLQVSKDDSGKLPGRQLKLQWLVTYSTNERDPTTAIS